MSEVKSKLIKLSKSLSDSGFHKASREVNLVIRKVAVPIEDVIEHTISGGKVESKPGGLKRTQDRVTSSYVDQFQRVGTKIYLHKVPDQFKELINSPNLIFPLEAVKNEDGSYNEEASAEKIFEKIKDYIKVEGDFDSLSDENKSKILSFSKFLADIAPKQDPAGVHILSGVARLDESFDRSGPWGAHDLYHAIEMRKPEEENKAKVLESRDALIKSLYMALMSENIGLTRELKNLTKGVNDADLLGSLFALLLKDPKYTVRGLENKISEARKSSIAALESLKGHFVSIMSL